MKNNYPIKYALMPIYDQVGWGHGLNELEREFEVVAYAVSKCYVLSEVKKYLVNGCFTYEYEVVFPYERDRDLNWNRVEPNFNLLNNNCINSKCVCNVFDCYEEAFRVAEKLNFEKMAKAMSYIPYTDDYEKIFNSVKIGCDKRLELIHELEKQIDDNTVDLKVNTKGKEQTIIVMLGDEDKIFHISLYDFINLYSYEKFIVSNVTENEFELMRKQVENFGALAERCSGIYELNYKNDRYLLANDPENGITKIVDINSSEDVGCYYLSDKNMYFDKEMKKFYNDALFKKDSYSIKVYTTEDYSDVIQSFIPNFVSKGEGIKINDNVIRRKLELK